MVEIFEGDVIKAIFENIGPENAITAPLHSFSFDSQIMFNEKHYYVVSEYLGKII